MAGLGALLVGYRRDDPRRLSALAQGIESVSIQKECIAGCGHEPYFVRSGIDAYMSRDPHVICQVCYDLYRDEIQVKEL